MLNKYYKFSTDLPHYKGRADLIEIIPKWWGVCVYIYIVNVNSSNKGKRLKQCITGTYDKPVLGY